MHFTARPIVVAGLLVAVSIAGAAAASGAEPIRPNQHFIGLVNASHATVDVHTVCPGPIWPGRTGPVVGDQTLSIARVGRGHGFTGPLSQVYAWFAQDVSGPTPKMVKFTSYGTERRVPASVRVPCDGKGEVEFSPCPFRAPCVAGWKPDIVTVRFVNLAL